ncbi:MAG: hypothetical protein JXM72_11505 [Deltaproteobacteria bacterium]|nr:hypothetical protein [Deltaproteobacteria bacterium]
MTRVVFLLLILVLSPAGMLWAVNYIIRDIGTYTGMTDRLQAGAGFTLHAAPRIHAKCGYLIAEEDV